MSDADDIGRVLVAIDVNRLRERATAAVLTTWAAELEDLEAGIVDAILDLAATGRLDEATLSPLLDRALARPAVELGAIAAASLIAGDVDATLDLEAAAELELGERNAGTG